MTEPISHAAVRKSLYLGNDAIYWLLRALCALLFRLVTRHRVPGARYKRRGYGV